MQEVSGAKILVTGPAGQIAFPLASRLAQSNEVWGIARFGDGKSRERVEAAGIQTRVVDLEDPNWGDLPADFDYVLHLAAFIAPGEDYELALRINAEGTGLLMEYCRNARSFLLMSTNSVYSSDADPAVPVLEEAPLGSGYQPFAPTYSVSKIAQEAVARSAARLYQLPTIIARMNVAYGDNGGLPAMLLDERIFQLYQCLLALGALCHLRGMPCHRPRQPNLPDGQARQSPETVSERLPQKSKSSK